MEIQKIQVLRGPNYWSNYRNKLIVMKLNIGKYEELPTNEIPHFYNTIMKLMPSLFEHRCSEGRAGGLCDRMREGTWLGHVIEHVALELQVLSGMDCGYGRTRSAGEYGVYNVVYSYLSEEAGILAGKKAIELVLAVAEKRKFDLKSAIAELSYIWRHEAPGPSTQAILDEATKRNIPFTRMDKDSLYMLGYGANQQFFRATVAGTTGSIGVDLVDCKWTTKEILGSAGIPVPKGMIISDKSQLDDAIDDISFPFVIKPVDGNHGRGITANIRTKEEALKAFKLASAISRNVIVEKYLVGDDYRFLVINYKLVAVAKRTPAMVTGDGLSTVKELIDKVNADPKRGDGHEKVLTAIKVDRHTKMLLKDQGLSLDSIAPLGMEVLLKRTANLSTGGTSTDVTDIVHPFNVFLAERIARRLKLDICGIDIVAGNVSVPISDENGAVIEVNAGPGFRMHTHPAIGQPRNVAKPVVDMLFPEGTDGRIPIVAVTGTNGKTTTTRLISHIAQHTGKSVGYTTTEGIYINGNVIMEGDCSGPASAKVILNDPMVDFAVLECARGGILRSGLAFDTCDVSIVTNVTEDHLGLNGIDTMEQYARVKEVVARSTAASGYSILNADDDLVYEMRNAVSANVILFSLDSTNPRLIAHREKEGMAVTVEDGYFVIYKGNTIVRLVQVDRVPLTFNGSAEFMVANILPAIAASVVSGFTKEKIVEALLSFIPSAELTPGRMNVFEFDHCRVMLDYAHNAAGFEGIEKYMKQVAASFKTGVINATGDRKDEDIRNLGKYAAKIFDHVIIRHDKDNRGRPNEELTALIQEGIQSVDPQKKVTVISDEKEAIEYALNTAITNSFIFVCADNVKHSLEIIQELQQTSVLIPSLQAS